MGLTEIQAKIRNIELQLSDLESEIEQMKPKAKAEEIEQYKKINQIAENHKIKNKPLLASDFTVRKSYVCSLGHLLLKRMNEKYESLLFLTRIAKGIQCYEDVEKLYQDVISYDEKNWKDSLMLLKEHKYSFIVDILILANLNKTQEENHLNLVADIAEILGGLGGAAVGTAGGFAAAGATTSAVMALGTASTGTAIASLSGAAATNATLAALGGGALSAGGGGIALGTSILGAATLGVGLLVGGVIFDVTGGKLSDKAEEARKQVEKEEQIVNQICIYLEQLDVAANRFYETLKRVKKIYDEVLVKLKYIVFDLEKTDWNMFDEQEKLQVQNAVLLVQLLYKMCQVSLVNKAKNEDDMNSVNQIEINNTIVSAEEVMRSVG